MIRTTEILTPATSGALTTLAALKDEVQAPDTSSDAYLMRRIIAASSGMAAYCGRVFGRETVRDTFRYDAAPLGPGDLLYGSYRLRTARPLELSRDMLASVDGVADRTGALLDPSTWYADLAAGLVYRVSAGRNIVWQDYPITVVFTSGWVLPGESAPTLPQIVEDVCIDTAAADYYSRGRDPGLRDETVEGVGRIRYTDTPFAQDIRLDPFRVHAR